MSQSQSEPSHGLSVRKLGFTLEGIPSSVFHCHDDTKRKRNRKRKRNGETEEERETERETIEVVMELSSFRLFTVSFQSFQRHF